MGFLQSRRFYYHRVQMLNYNNSTELMENSGMKHRNNTTLFNEHIEAVIIQSISNLRIMALLLSNIVFVYFYLFWSETFKNMCVYNYYNHNKML